MVNLSVVPESKMSAKMTDVQFKANESAFDEEVEFEIIVQDQPYSSYLLRVGADCVLLWLGRSRCSTTIAFGHQLATDAKSSRVLEPLNYNSTVLANLSTKLSAILHGKQVFFTTDLNTDLTESEFWRDALEELGKSLTNIIDQPSS